MKRCPTCQRTYTDDSLRFCLQDGTVLLSIDDAPASFDPSATLVLSEGERREPPLPTEVLAPQTAQTIPARKPAPTAPPQPPRSTVYDEPERTVHSPRSQNSALVAGLALTVALLLLALGGMGAWMLLRDDKGGEKEARTGDNQNKNIEPTANSNGRSASPSPVSSSQTPTPSPTTTATTPPYASR